MTALVTGASGHIGGVLVRALLSQQRHVRALVHRRSDALEGLHGPLEIIGGNVLDPESLARACEGVETVFHLAGKISIDGDPDGRVHAINVDGTRHVADAALAANVTKMVHVSSVHAYDVNSGAPQITEDSPKIGPQGTAYDRSKAEGEAQLKEVVAKGLDGVVVNPAGVIGPFDFGPSKMGLFFLDLARRKLPALVQGGFSWVDVRDVASGIIAAEARGRRGENYFLSGPWCSMADMAAHAESITAIRAPAFNVPIWLASLAAPAMVGWASLRGSEPLYTKEALHAVQGCKDLSWQKAAQQLGHAPRAVEDSIRDVYRWFSQNGILHLPDLEDAEKVISHD